MLPPATRALRAGSRLLQQLIQQQHEQRAAVAAAAAAAPAAAARLASSSSSAAAPAAKAAAPASERSRSRSPPLPPAPQTQHDPFTREQRMGALLRALVQPIPSSAVNQGQLSPHLVNLSPDRGARARALVDPADALGSLLRALLAARAALREDGHIVVLGSSPTVAPIVRAAAASCLSPNVWFMAEGWRPGALTNHRSHRRLFQPDAHQPARRALREWGLLPANPHVAAAGAQHPGAAPSSWSLSSSGAAPAATASATGLSAAPLPARLSWRDKWALYARAREPGTRALLEALIAREDRAHPLAAPDRPRGARGLMPRLRLLVVLDPTFRADGLALSEAAARGVPTAALVAHNVDLADVTYPVLGRGGSPRMAWLLLDRLVKVANVGA
jgi:hypothetical protein